MRDRQIAAFVSEIQTLRKKLEDAEQTAVEITKERERSREDLASVTRCLRVLKSDSESDNVEVQWFCEQWKSLSGRVRKVSQQYFVSKTKRPARLPRTMDSSQYLSSETDRQLIV
ncbi:hypothetical protein P154DRAFT_575357 [Amniculicola lignicola CBS 123094]|uniref:Uncharacterized protein n=1 Tax=Amniculicola lignicola CBS 123094 TaxID=1392246 RepID=A0A6A5WHB7_9PLEO|nr:hypothetical protein P154DRAFT_575357 [Amniculicola lignicola CBS 123094]